MGSLANSETPELSLASQVMTEKNIQTLFGKWLKENEQDNSYAYELKICKQKAIPLNSVKEHQVQGLLQAKKGMYYKISDSPIFAGMNTKYTASKPFDCFWIKVVESFIGICWYIPRKQKYLHLIPIDKWLNLVKTHHKKSVHEIDVAGISTIIKL